MKVGSYSWSFLPTHNNPRTDTQQIKRSSKTSIMKAKSVLVSIAAVTSSTLTLAQEQYPDYQDYADGYEQDDLYQNYANKQQEKAVGGG